LPDGRVTRGVKNGNYYNAPRLDAVVNAVGKARYKCLAHIFQNDRIPIWLDSDDIQYSLECSYELIARSCKLPIIPRDSFVQFGASDCAKDQQRAHDLSRD
jgi:hypothetical protein